MQQGKNLGCVSNHCCTSPRHTACPGCSQDVSKVDGKFRPRAKLHRSLIFPPRGKVSMEARTMLQHLPFPWEALSKHLLVRVVPVRGFGNQHPRNWLGTAISRQIWQFRRRKHKRFLLTGMYPTPMKEITALPAMLEEGLRCSPSAPVCCLACYLQLKSFCCRLLCPAMEGGTGGDGRRAKPPHLQQLLRGGSRQLPPAPAEIGRAHLEASFISYILSHSSKNIFNHIFFFS